MENFQLSLLLTIPEIGSASGLLYHKGLLYIISDSSNYLYEYDMDSEKLNKIPLIENPQGTIPKKYKPDFESIALYKNKITVLGSGSTSNRNRGVLYDPASGQTETKDLTEIYQKIKGELHFTDNELNIEGVIFDQKSAYFFQRGNGAEGKNGIIHSDDNLKFTAFELPKIKNVATTFTDAILVDGKIYFLAAAEDSLSTYEDGEILGSIIGTIDLNTMKLIDWIQITDSQKFEGLTLYKKDAEKLDFLICEDNDTEEPASAIYKLSIGLG